MTFVRSRLVRSAFLGALAVLGVTLLAPPSRADEPAPDAPLPTWTPEQLRELVGPIALYPDVVLASLLPATNFPLDVVSASRWVESQGDQPTAAPDDQPWDASVKALVQFPDVLQWMNTNLQWLEQMGAAVTYQQADVLRAIQDFRRAARAAGNLASDEHLTIGERREAEAPATAPTVIVIESTRPEIVYVPVYDPYVIVRPWFVRPVRPLLSFGIGFNVGFGGAWAWHDLRWGWWSGSAYQGWGIYVGDSYYYSRLPRPSAWYVGPYRPQPWRAPYRTSSWRYPPRAIRPTTAFSTRSGTAYRSGTGSYVLRPPVDPRPTPRAGVRAVRAPTGSTVTPAPDATFARTRMTRTLPPPSPTVRTSPWSGSTPSDFRAPSTSPRIRTLPTPSPTGSRVVMPPVGPSARPWSVRGNGSLAPKPVVTAPTPQAHTLPPPKPRYIRPAPLPTPFRVPTTPTQGAPRITRRSGDRGRSSLFTPPPPPESPTPPPPPKSRRAR